VPSELSSDTGRPGGRVGGGGGAHALPVRRRPVRPVASCGRGWRGRSTARLIVISAADGDETTATRRGSVGVGLSRPACPPIRVAYTPLGRAWLAMRPRSSPVHRTPVAAAGMAFGLSPASHPPNTQLYSIVGQSLQIVSRPKDAWSVFLLPTYPEWTARVQHHLWSQRQCSTCYRLFGGVVGPPETAVYVMPIGKHAACQPAAR
jgi:hypothetical protein